MATINLGRVGFVNKGTYSTTPPYKVNDVVTYNRGTYACIQANTGKLPTDIAYWQVWVENTAPSNTGEGATGTWEINITGSASKLNNKIESIPTIANTLVERDSNGNINTNTINISQTATVDTATKYYVETNNDGYLRPKVISDVKTEIAGDKITKVTSTDNAVVRFNGTTGEVQNSSVIIDDSGNVGIGTSSPIDKLGVKGSIAISSLVGTTYTDGSGILLYRGADNTQMGYIGFGGSVTPFELVNSKNTGFNFYNGEVLQKTAYGIGYGTGAGGTVTQLTSKSTAVTLNKPTGQITMNNAALAAGGVVTFNVHNSLLSVGDLIYISISNANGVNVQNYNCWVTLAAVGLAFITIKNIYTSSLSDAVVINYAIIKGAIS